MKLPYEFSKAITDKITVAPDDINIIAMHHPFHWNDNDTYKDIKNYIESMANYLFLGHEHVYDSNYKRTKDGRNVNTFEGRLFSNKNILDGFGLIKIDNNNVTKKVFSWITECFEEIENSSYQVENSKNGVHLSDKMMHFIDKMELIPNIEDKTTLSDLFVSPLIFKYANEDEKFKIDTDEILKGTFDKKYIIIRADDKYGKTSLLKMIMKARYQQGKYPVFIDGKELIYSKIKDCSILAKKFEEQYENKSAGFYNSLDRNKKIVLIDDMDGNLRQSDFLPFLMNLSDLVDEIFVTVSSEFSDMLTWKNKQGTQFNTKFERWELVKWNNSKKLDLFQKWFSFNNMEMDVQRIEKLENSLDIPFQKGIMPVTPFYILSALYLEKNGISLSGISPESMCAEFYRAIITLSLLKVGVNNQKINQCFNYIKYIAYAIFNSDIKEISPDGLKNIHDDYIRKKNIVFFLVGGMYLSAIHHISVHMANSDLMPTHKELCEDKELSSKFMNIINFYNKMVNQAEFPLSDLTSLIKGLSETSYLFNVADTFVLLIPYEQDDILRPERFSPSLDILHNMGTAQSVTCFNFATKIEQQAHYCQNNGQ